MAAKKDTPTLDAETEAPEVRSIDVEATFADIDAWLAPLASREAGKARTRLSQALEHIQAATKEKADG